jgi:L-threonylcarbamoyladenylate synthase
VRGYKDGEERKGKGKGDGDGGGDDRSVVGQSRTEVGVVTNGDGGRMANQSETNWVINNHEAHHPRAPGMKYRHYAPNARVYLFESSPKSSSSSSSSSEEAARAKLISYCQNNLDSSSSNNKSRPQPSNDGDVKKIGVIATKTWRAGLGLGVCCSSPPSASSDSSIAEKPSCYDRGGSGTTTTSSFSCQDPPELEISTFYIHIPPETKPTKTLDPTPNPNFSHIHSHIQIHALTLGPSISAIARNLFSALRELDARGCDVILIEGIGDKDGNANEEREGLAAAVMNRLRKAAE